MLTARKDQVKDFKFIPQVPPPSCPPLPLRLSEELVLTAQKDQVKDFKFTPQAPLSR